MADEILAEIAFLFLGREGDGFDRRCFLDHAGCGRRVDAVGNHLEPFDAIVVGQSVFELGTVALAQLGWLDERYGRHCIVDDGEGEAAALAPEVDGDAHRLTDDDAGLIGAIYAGQWVERDGPPSSWHHADLRPARAYDADGDL